MTKQRILLMEVDPGHVCFSAEHGLDAQTVRGRQ